MKFSKNYSKLEYPIFTTIRQNKGYYKVGDKIDVVTPNDKFSVEVLSIRELCLEDITEHLALLDADCSKKDFEKLMYKFYKNNTDDLILLTLGKF